MSSRYTLAPARRYGDDAGEISAIRLYEELAGVEVRLSKGGESGASERSVTYAVLNVPSDARIASLAAKQYGHITYQQLIALGLTRRQIALRIKKGQLIPVHRGVYAVGPPAPRGHRPRRRCRSRVRPARGSQPLLGRAPLWGLGTRWPTIHEVTVPARRRPSGIWIHVHPILDSQDIRKHRGIRLTSPARTVLDIAPRQTDRAADNARSARRY